jgi:DNA topoisomerase-3
LKAGEERRIDITDGNAYTLAQFIEQYGGTLQWDIAKPTPGADDGSARIDGAVDGADGVLGRDSKPFCRAPHSGHYLRLRLHPRPHLYNAQTAELTEIPSRAAELPSRTIPLPVGGSFRLYNERRCPLCAYELLLFAPNTRGAAGQRTYPLCPGCFCQPPLPGGMDPDDEGRCSRCPHPEAHPIVAELGVCACPETADLGGQLLLDPTGGPHWRLVSSRSALVRSFPPFVHQVSLGPRCGCAGTCRKIVVEFQRGRSPLADGATRHVGCVLSDELLEALFQSAEMGGKRRGRLQS